jgi:hypothetical protein
VNPWDGEHRYRKHFAIGADAWPQLSRHRMFVIQTTDLP